MTLAADGEGPSNFRAGDCTNHEKRRVDGPDSLGSEPSHFTALLCVSRNRVRMLICSATPSTHGTSREASCCNLESHVSGRQIRGHCRGSGRVLAWNQPCLEQGLAQAIARKSGIAEGTRSGNGRSRRGWSVVRIGSAVAG